MLTTRIARWVAAMTGTTRARALPGARSQATLGFLGGPRSRVHRPTETTGGPPLCRGPVPRLFGMPMWGGL